MNEHPPLPNDLASYADSAHSALIIIDIQNDFVHDEGKAAQMGSDLTAAQATVGQINRLIAGAREAGALVVFAQIEHAPETDRPNYRARYRQRNFDPNDLLCATGSWGAALYDKLLPPLEDEPVVIKYGYDAFQDTHLNEILQTRGVQSLIMTGVVTNLCVQTTAEHGFGLGYYVVTVSDATAGDTAESHAAAIHNLGAYFGLVADTDAILSVWRESPSAQPSRAD